MRRSTLVLLGLSLAVAVATVFLLLQSSRGASPSRVAQSGSVPARVVESEADAADSTAPASPPLALSGHVVDERGTPVPEAELSLLEPGPEPRRVEVALDGGFRIDLERAGTVRVAARARGRRGFEREFQVPEHGLEVVIELRDGAELAGRVRAGRGDPSRYRVSLEDASGSELQAACDGQGVYDFESLEPGVYRVHLDAPARRWNDVGSVELRAGERTLHDVEVPASGAIEVRARLPERAAGRATQLYAELLPEGSELESRHGLALDRDGRGRIDDLDPGTYALRAVLERIPSQIARVEVPARGTADAVLTWPAGRIAGRVTDPGGRAASVEVRAQPLRVLEAAEVPDSALVYETRTDADGRYRLDALAAGDYLVRASGDGEASDRVRVSADGAALLDLRLGVPLGLQVRVAEDGAPIAGAVVYALRAPYSDWAAQAETDALGRARIQGLTAGSYRLVTRVLSKGDVRTASTDVRVGEGPPAPVTLEIGSR